MGIFRHKAIPIIAISILIYFVWGHFGFAGAWVPGKYDAQTDIYNVFWYKEGFACHNGYFRIKFYTPFKKHGLCAINGRVVIPFLYDNLEDVEDSGPIAILKNGKRGAVDKLNNVIAKAEWDNIRIYQNEIYVSKGKFPDIADRELLDKTGQPIFVDKPIRLGDWMLKKDAPVRMAFALKDSVSYIYFANHQKVIRYPYYIASYAPPASAWSRAFAITGSRNKEAQEVHYALLDTAGSEILPLAYDYIKSLYDYEETEWVNIYLIRKDGKQGIYDANTRKWTVPLAAYRIRKDYNLPLFTLESENGKMRYVDVYGTLIFSEKVTVKGNVREYVNFRLNEKDYYLKYDKDKGKFYWYRGTKEL